jgi:hypothetical protein
VTHVSDFWNCYLNLSTSLWNMKHQLPM